MTNEVAWTGFQKSETIRVVETILDKSESAILARALELEVGNLTPELAEYVLTIDLTDEDQQAARELAVLAKHGTLTAEQSVELENYRRAGRIFELLKSKARLALRNGACSPAG